eukprot:m.5727 g.5727  ORF g.5727 m.5727 type:complete len:464 (+) comp3377_c0_seq1:78-1469(+)
MNRLLCFWSFLCLIAKSSAQQENEPLCSATIFPGRAEVSGNKLHVKSLAVHGVTFMKEIIPRMVVQDTEEVNLSFNMTWKALTRDNDLNMGICDGFGPTSNCVTFGWRDAQNLGCKIFLNAFVDVDMQWVTEQSKFARVECKNTPSKRTVGLKLYYPKGSGLGAWTVYINGVLALRRNNIPRLNVYSKGALMFATQDGLHEQSEITDVSFCDTNILGAELQIPTHKCFCMPPRTVSLGTTTSTGTISTTLTQTTETTITMSTISTTTSSISATTLSFTSTQTSSTSTLTFSTTKTQTLSTTSTQTVSTTKTTKTKTASTSSSTITLSTMFTKLESETSSTEVKGENESNSSKQTLVLTVVLMLAGFLVIWIVTIVVVKRYEAKKKITKHLTKRQAAFQNPAYNSSPETPLPIYQPMDTTAEELKYETMRTQEGSTEQYERIVTQKKYGNDQRVDNRNLEDVYI